MGEEGNIVEKLTYKKMLDSKRKRRPHIAEQTCILL